MDAGSRAAVSGSGDAMAVLLRLAGRGADLLRRAGASLGGRRRLRSARATSTRQALAAERDAMARRTPAIALAVVMLQDLPEVELLFGRRAARNVVAATEARLRALAGRRGFVGRTGAASFAVLLSTSGGDTTALHAALAQATSIEMEVGDEELVVLAAFAVSDLAPETSMEHAYRELSGRIANAQQRERRLPRRATGASSAVHGGAPEYRPTFPATLPAALPATYPATMPAPLR